jgi:predicted nuclease of restriction endonuclease-like RecB superfamily
MLTADLVRTRRRNGHLQVLALKGKAEHEARELAEVLLRLTQEQEGNTYAHLQEAWDSVHVAPNERKLSLGLQKLIEDDCDFEETTAMDPRALRESVFLLAARARQASSFDRARLFTEVALTHGFEAETLEANLYSDLRSEHIVKRTCQLSASELVTRYKEGQYQAILLRAVSVTAIVRCSQPAAYRELFRTLKFRRLLFTIHEEDGAYRIELDGPFSLFEAVTKYGLQLALAFPILRRCDSLSLTARLRWGKEREELRFDYVEDRDAAPPDETRGSQPIELERLPDEVQHFLEAFQRAKSAWSVAASDRLFNLPGIGICVPDLVFRSGQEEVFFEVMGFWSRDAVWKRVELVERGLPQKVIFAVSSRLRVSESVLDDAASSALYVYKGVMSPRAVIEKLEGLRGK